MRYRAFADSWAAIVLLASVAACSATQSMPSTGAAVPDAGPDSSYDAASPAITFQPTSPSVYVAKVKNILVGLPPTDDKVKQVEADPSTLKTLIQSWMTLPQYTVKMKRFFELAFQQTQVSAVDFSDQAYPKQVDINATTTPLLVQNAQQSFTSSGVVVA